MTHVMQVGLKDILVLVLQVGSDALWNAGKARLAGFDYPLAQVRSWLKITGFNDVDLDDPLGGYTVTYSTVYTCSYTQYCKFDEPWVTLIDLDDALVT